MCNQKVKVLYQFLIHAVKTRLPQSLFGRALLILVLPTLLVQLLAIYIFYERHWSSIQRHLSASLAGEVTVVIERSLQTMGEEREAALMMYGRIMNMRIRLLPATSENLPPSTNARFSTYRYELRKRLNVPFVVYELPHKEAIRTLIMLPQEIVQIDVGIKRLESSTTYIFVTWVIGSTLLLTLIAIMFLRNQIRPMARLAEAAERFGRGQDVGNYRPHGAEEVRKAGKAFMVMRSRILRQVTTRITMLTGISHDLRTPLTRLKLQLAMLPSSDENSAMQQDINEMEQMLQEYLEFARGNDETVPSEIVNMAEWLREIVYAYLNTGAGITYSLPETVFLPIRQVQMRRAVQNLITNALNYGESCHVYMEVHSGWLHIAVEDNGIGIPEEEMEEVFRPFTRLEASRNHETGGVGLGLSIARDIAHAHGGKIQMFNRYDKERHILGLSVVLMLPIPA
jgi:two-component system, OmpR family, osmolarity sensor histidine kinase EnvZ